MHIAVSMTRADYPIYHGVYSTAELAMQTVDAYQQRGGWKLHEAWHFVENVGTAGAWEAKFTKQSWSTVTATWRILVENVDQWVTSDDN